MITPRAFRPATFLLVTAVAMLLPAAGALAAPSDYPPVTSTASGHVYLDTNGNGTQDPGEPDLAGVDVTVTDSTGASQTVTTDANGNWVAEIAPGTATADIDESTLPAGVVQTEGSDPNSFDSVAGEIVDGGTDGYTPTSSATGIVYIDTDGDGVRDRGEPGISGVTITITDSTGTRTVTTDANGNWSVSVRPGPVTITINETTLPNGVVISEGSQTYNLTAVANQELTVRNGYKPEDGPEIPGTGSDSTAAGLRLGVGLVALGAGLVLVSRTRRPRPAVA